MWTKALADRGHKKDNTEIHYFLKNRPIQV
jgi:hypothetical protein